MGTLLLYDADCGFCTRAISLAPRLRLRATIGTIQDTDLAALGIDAERAQREMPAVVDGRARYGHRAIAAGLRTGPAPVRLLGLIVGARPLGWLFGPLYRWVADRRHSLPGGTAACELPRR
ncbi:thiol-disulfide oxidoreductase DCC family protein [Nocardioides sp.]|uniref:thiol-disulfide oxidoreductase DCC family protein n=1 Tax=Nocardioides sp. TaxID=35761 RepID=UPI0039E43030